LNDGTETRDPDAPTALRLHLVRAGSAADAENRCIGQTDLPLSKSGMRECRLLLRQLHLTDATVISSDLQRARNTAAMLTGGHVIEEPRLRDMHFGEWEGATWAELEEQVGAPPRTESAKWTTIRPPGGESFADVVTRVSSWLDALPRDGGDYLVVAHAGSIRAIAVLLLEIPPARAFSLALDHARVSLFEISTRGASLLLWNSSCA
jgi:alpha-ribazole phosphatase